jgi:hypothetical protein
MLGDWGNGEVGGLEKKDDSLRAMPPGERARVAHPRLAIHASDQRPESWLRPNLWIVIGGALFLGSLLGLVLLPEPPDPSESEEALYAYDRWMRVWFLIAFLGFLGFSALLVGLTDRLFGRRDRRAKAENEDEAR